MKYKFVTPWTSMIVVKEKDGNQKKKKKKKKPKPSEMPKDPLQAMRYRVNQLEKKEVHLDKQMQVCLNNARAQSKKRNKKGALFQLKKKKEYEKQLESIQSDKLNLETQIMALEDATLNAETFKSMKTSANAMKCTIKEADLDKADELMEDINEAMNVNEMNEAMSQPLGVMMDDDELEAELAELEELEADELLDEIGDVIGNYHALGTEQKFEVDPVYSTFIKMKKTTADPQGAPPQQQQQFSVLSHDANHFQGFTFERPKKTKSSVNDLFGDLPSAPSRPVARQSEENQELAELEAMMSIDITTIEDDSKIQTQSEEKKEDVIKKVFEAYDNEDIRIIFECIESSKASGLCRILATFYNKSKDEITDFKFTVKVEEYMKLTMKAANGIKLLASSQNSITQQFESVNTKYGEQPFVIDFEVSFTKDSTEIILKSSVKIPDYFV
eukprot:262116_1